MTEQRIEVLPGLWPIHGDGVLARQGDLVLLIHPAGGAFTDRLLDLLTDAARAGETGLRFASLISAEFDSDAAAAASEAPGPAAVAFGRADDGLAIAIYGTAWAEITTAHGTQQLTAGQPYGRLQCVLPSRVMRVRAGVLAADGDASTDPYLRLADGVVRAVALVYAPEETPRRTPDRGRHVLLPERTVMDAAWGEQAAAPSDQLDQAEQAVPEPIQVPAEPPLPQQQEAGQAERPAYEPQAPRVDDTFYQPDAGQAVYQPDAGQAVYQPDAGQAVYQPDAGQAVYQPDAGQAVYQPDAGQAVYQPDACAGQCTSPTPARPRTAGRVPARHRPVSPPTRQRRTTWSGTPSKPTAWPARRSSPSRSSATWPAPSCPSGTRCRSAPNLPTTTTPEPQTSTPRSSSASTARTGISTTPRRATAPSAASAWPS